MGERVGVVARREIRRAQRDFVGRARRAIGEEHDDDLHAARIAAKRLRYTIEFFSSVLGPDRATVLGLLTLIQDRLGEIADDETFARFYRELAEDLPQSDPRRAGIAMLVDSSKRRRKRTIEDVRKLWRGADFPPYPDMLVASISASLASSPSRAMRSGGAATTSAGKPNERTNKSDL